MQFHKSQIMGTIHCSKCRTGTQAFKQAIYQVKGDYPEPVYQNGNNYSLVVDSMELLYKLTLFENSMFQIKVQLEFLHCYLYHIITTIMLHITRTVVKNRSNYMI